MSTRFRTNAKNNLGQPPVPSGYERPYGTSDLSIPSCGVEDVDVGVFNLFDKEIAPEVGRGSTDAKKVPVLFAAGEKGAMLKRGRPIRDRNNTLLLPLIAITNTGLSQDMSGDVAGRGVNQQVGEMVVRRRLDKSDRGYQSLINRLFLANQRNLAVGPSDAQVPGQVTTDRRIGQLAGRQDLLSQDRTNDVWETIVVPMPQFYTVKYQVTIWTQYTQHSNQIIEKVFGSLLPQGQSWRVDTPKGYWFVARMSDGSFVAETNFDDMSDSERFIKHTFELEVPAYFFLGSAPGMPVPIKRYVSCAAINFEASDPVEVGSEKQDSLYVIGSDDPTLPTDERANDRRDQRTPGWRAQKVYPILQDLDPVDRASDQLEQPLDPAAASASRGSSIKVVSRSPRGEVVYTGAKLAGLDIVVTK